MLIVFLVYRHSRFTSTPPQRLTSPPVTHGGFLRSGTAEAAWQHRATIEFRSLSDDHSDLADSPQFDPGLGMV